MFFPYCIPGGGGGGSLEHPVLCGHGGGHVAGQAAAAQLRGVRLRGVELGAFLKAGIVHRLQGEVGGAPRRPRKHLSE